ncbi:MAG: peptidoglycan DD-metalloendopeptidase family protein [Pseudomonadota bacterium]
MTTKRRIFTLTALLAGFAVALSVEALALQTRGDDSDLTEIERELEARRRDEARLKDEAAARAREVADLRASMIETATGLQAAEGRIKEITEDITRLEKEETELSGDLRQDSARLSDILGGLIALERSRPPALFAAPDDAVEAARAAMLLSEAAPELKAEADALRAAIDRLAALRGALADEREAQKKTNEEISARRLVLAELLRTKQEERTVAERLAEAAQSETAALAARASSLRGVLSELERLARSIAPRLKPVRGASAQRSAIRAPSLRFRPQTAFEAARGRLRPPVVGEIIARFGERRSDGGVFDGIRYAADPNALVTSPHDASVDFAQFYPAVGNLIVLDVGAGYHILLMGVGSFLVDEGQTVAAGEPVGVMTPGASVLDLEIRQAREPVNPLLWLTEKTDG